jgi:N-acetylglucosamine-6-phosphate deacetylase
MYDRFRVAARNRVKIVSVSPELEGAYDFIDAAAKSAVVAVAHSNAGYDATAGAFGHGAKHATHLFNAMSPLTHRDPNVVGAVLDTPGISAELICDGVHLHPAAVRLALKALGMSRAVFVSDSMMATGLGDGTYDLGGLEIVVSGKIARLVHGGNIASSVSNLTDCFRVAVKEMGVPLADAVRCVSVNPARVLGMEGERGRICEGLTADLIFMDTDLNICEIILRGRRLTN